MSFYTLPLIIQVHVVALEVLGEIFDESPSRGTAGAKVIREYVGQFVVDVTLVVRAVDLGNVCVCDRISKTKTRSVGETLVQDDAGPKQEALLVGITM